MKRQPIQLSDHFDCKRLIRYTLPSIFMMIFTSIYGVVDGFFVSNYVGKTPFAAVNLIMPPLMILGAAGFLLGAGGGALIARTMGEGDREKANRLFSLFVWVAAGVGVALAGAGLLLARPVAQLLGAEGQLLEYCVAYAQVILLATPAYILQFEFQSFFPVAEKPQLGLWFTVATGLSNMLLDWLFVAVLHWGLEGAALATAASQVAGGILPLIYFARPNTSALRLGRPAWDGRALVHACGNGSSELVSTLSMSLVGMLYNGQLMRYAGEDGVAAYGVLMYVNLIFLAVFIGYSVGSAPVVSFHYGAGHKDELRGILRRSLMMTGGAALSMLALALLLARPLSQIFVGYDPDLMEMTLQGFWIYSFSFLFAGFSIYGSSFFTALNNGLISAAISFLRTVVFQVAAVLLLPLIWELKGIWISIVAAEVLSAAVTAFFLTKTGRRYYR